MFGINGKIILSSFKITKKGSLPDSEEAVEEDLCAADEAEAHAEAEQTAGVGDVRRLRDLLVLLEPLGVRILDEDVEHDQVLAGVLQDHLFDGAGRGRAVGHVLARDVPVVVLAKVLGVEPEDAWKIVRVFFATVLQDFPAIFFPAIFFPPFSFPPFSFPPFLSRQTSLCSKNGSRKRISIISPELTLRVIRLGEFSSIG
jgi:hypothetical protein